MAYKPRYVNRQAVIDEQIGKLFRMSKLLIEYAIDLPEDAPELACIFSVFDEDDTSLKCGCLRCDIATVEHYLYTTRGGTFDDRGNLKSKYLKWGAIESANKIMAKWERPGLLLTMQGRKSYRKNG